MFTKSFRLVSMAVFLFLYMAIEAYPQSDNLGGSNTEDSGPIASGTTTVTKTTKEISKKINLSPADKAWSALPEYKSQKNANDQEGLIKSVIYHERFSREYFEKGFSFWRAFPKDQRRYEWLRLTTSGYVPRFWKNVEEGARLSLKSEFYSTPVDEIALKNWAAVIKTAINDYLNEPKIRKEDKDLMIISELNNVFEGAYNESYWESDGEFIAKVKQSFEDAHRFIGADPLASARLVKIVDKLFLGSLSYGVELKELREIVMSYKDDIDPVVRNWVIKKLRLLDTDLSNIPLFNDSIFGNQLEITKFRNKVVLLDYWNIYCSTCIARMSVLKPLYEKHNSSGFEIISVSIDPKTQQQKVEKIQQEFAGDWTHILIGGEDEIEFKSNRAPWKKIWDLYGFNTIPQMMLYNREGKLVALNGLLIFGNPEAMIKETLESVDEITDLNKESLR